MKYVHQHNDFNLFINQIADRLQIDKFVIEKDYWVTYILKNISKSEFKDEMIFKGGTCLSKAYNLIDRFSEDIDLLVIETDKTISKRQKELRLKNFRNFLDTISDIKYVSGNRSDLYASFRYGFDTKNETGVISKEVLLEPGYRGGIKPKIETKEITSFVEKELDGKLNEYDTKPFDIKILSLERIFIEKLFAIKELFEKNTIIYKTRHYYDIYRLLQTKEIKDLLKNTDEIKNVVEDINDVNKKYFKIEPILWKDLINHKSIKADKDLFEKLNNGYINDKQLYFKEQPDFKTIIYYIKGMLNG